MPTYQPLHQGIHYVDAAHVRDELASIYILQQGDEVAIIDTGTCHSLNNVQSTLTELGVDNNQIKYVIPTHIHLDHAGGAGAMMRLFEQARLVIHPRGARHMIDPTRLIEGSKAVYGESLFRQLYGEITPIDEDRVDIANDLDRYYLGSRELLFIDTPGHARHHFCIYDDQSRGIFTGDTYGLAYPPLKHHPRGLIPTSSPVQFDPEAMFTSIDRLLSYQPEWMYLTHYGAIDRPAERAIGLKQWIGEYITLCQRIDPQDSEADRQLESEMRGMIFSKFSDDNSLDENMLARLLNTDIKLNAQGLAIWWRSNANS
jgi:glyoxylase-like metal-dependent hydrolase (beta-lactamase superfamily II)